ELEDRVAHGPSAGRRGDVRYGRGHVRRACSVDGEDELAADMPGVADLLRRGGLGERVGGDGRDQPAGLGLLCQGGQLSGRAFPGALREDEAELARAEVGEGRDALGAAAQGDGVLEGSLAGYVEHRI